MTRLVKFANNAVSRLAGNITNIATTLTITPGDGAKFPALGAGEYFPATLVKADGTLEIVKVTARSTDTLTIERAIEPVGGVQTAHSFSAGDKIELRLTAGSVGSELDRLEAAYLPKAGGTMTGPLGLTGAALNEAEGDAIASATTVDLDAATGNFLHITGTTAITTVTLGQGRGRTVVFDGALTLTNGANLILPTGANITTAAGDVAVFRGEGTGVTRCVAYTRANGQPLVPLGLALLEAHQKAADPHAQYIDQQRGDVRYVKLSQASALSLPAGSLIYYAGSVAPAGYLEANGAWISRTTYAALFAAIGIIYNAGDGSTTFGLPDLRGEFLRGWDNGRGLDAGRLIGSWQGDAIRNITGEYQPYPFGLTTNSAKGAFASTTQDNRVAQQQGGANEGWGTVRFDASKVVPTANENRPRNVAVLICIKY